MSFTSYSPINHCHLTWNRLSGCWSRITRFVITFGWRISTLNKQYYLEKKIFSQLFAYRMWTMTIGRATWTIIICWRSCTMTLISASFQFLRKRGRENTCVHLRGKERQTLTLWTIYSNCRRRLFSRFLSISKALNDAKTYSIYYKDIFSFIPFDNILFELIVIPRWHDTLWRWWRMAISSLTSMFIWISHSNSLPKQKNLKYSTYSSKIKTKILSVPLLV